MEETLRHDNAGVGYLFSQRKHKLWGVGVSEGMHQVHFGSCDQLKILAKFWAEVPVGDSNLRPTSELSVSE